LGIAAHFGQLQLVNGSRVEPSQQRSVGQVN